MRLQTCMLPRELIWEGMAPPQHGMTQCVQEWPGRKKLYSTLIMATFQGALYQVLITITILHYNYINLCPPGCLCLVHPLCIVSWKHWHPCMAVCLCPSHLISSPTPCLECVHASVHEFMSTLHPTSGPPPTDSYMESLVPLCVTACVSKSPYFCSYTLFRMCTSIST